MVNQPVASGIQEVFNYFKPVLLITEELNIDAWLIGGLGGVIVS